MSEKIFSTRIDEELQREFRSVVVRKGLTVSSVVRQLMVNYINEFGTALPATDRKESEEASS